jgi:predicted metal-dependent phosphoesterase TrpH
VRHRDGWFQEFLRRLRDGRERRAERMVEKLNALGIPLDFARVRSLASGAVGRPHVARALVEAGVVATTEEAFQKYIGRSGPAYVERVAVSPPEAIRIIRQAGGIAVLAHPGWGVGDDLIRELAAADLDGLEVYYPDHTPAMVEHYLALARELGLLVTGGTDFHGGDPATTAVPGSQYVPREVVDRLRERARERSGDGRPPRADPAPP